MPGAEPYYFFTWTGSPSAGSNDGAGNVAHFDYPTGLAADAVGNVYVADTGNHLVRKIAPNGSVTTLAGRALAPGWTDGRGAAARFYFPQAVAVAADGSLYVGDTFTVRRVAADGTVTTLAGSGGEAGLADGTGPAARFAESVRALQVEPDGSVLVLDSRTLRRLRPDRSVTTLFTKDHFWINGLFRAMTRDAMGNLYLALVGPQSTSSSPFQTRLYRLSPAGNIFVVADETSGLAGVRNTLAIARDQTGNLFLADNNLSVIHKLSPSGVVTLHAGAPGAPGAQDGTALAARFSGPAGLALDLGGNLLVSENNNTIRRITPGGTVTTVAGMSEEESGRHVDGESRAARFRAPEGIAVGGLALVADTANHVIRWIYPDGSAGTLAGNPGVSGYADGTGPAARFTSPRDIGVDAAGNVYVIEDNSTVRKITPFGVVTTLAGNGTRRNQPIDGSVLTNGYSIPMCLAVTPAGEVYVLERGVINHVQFAYFEHFSRIRRIAPNGTITTEWTGNDPHFGITGLAVAPDGAVYFCDPGYLSVYKLAAGAVQRFFLKSFAPRRIAIGASGRIFLAEDARFGGAGRVAEMLPDGNVEIIAGDFDQPGHLDGLGPEARFDRLSGIAVGPGDVLYLTSLDNTIRIGVRARAPIIDGQPQDRSVSVGSSLSLTVAASANPSPVFQWYFNGVAIPGAKGPGINFGSVKASDAGEYSVVVSNELGSVTSRTAVLAVTAPAPPTTPAPTGGSGAAGGGGAPSGWFLGALTALAAIRRWRRRLAVILRRKCPTPVRATD